LTKVIKKKKQTKDKNKIANSITRGEKTPQRLILSTPGKPRYNTKRRGPKRTRASQNHEQKIELTLTLDSLKIV